MERLILRPLDPRPEGVPALIHCRLNPSDVEMTRDSGLAPRPAPLFGAAGPALGYAQEAVTNLSVNLLIESETQAGHLQRDVREHTRPLYRLAERPAAGIDRPALVDLVWGKDWAFRGAITRLAERLEMFTPQGTAMRSWLRMACT